MLSLNLKNLWARKWRSAMTAIAVILGIALVAGTYVLTDTTTQAFDEIFVKSLEGTDVAITAKSEVDQEDGSTPSLPAKYLERVRRVSGVELAAGTVFTPGAILDSEGDSTGGGFSPQFISSTLPEELESLDYVEGTVPSGAHQASLDKAAAERSDLGLGDSISLVGTGEAQPFRLVGLTELGGASFGGTSIAQVTLPVAQQLAGKQGEFDQISVSASPAVSPEELRDRISEVLPKSVRVETGTENAERNADDIREGLSFLTIALLAFAGIALFVGSFVIFNVFSITVAQRTREFGMLRTLGASRRQILRTVLFESFVVGLLGSVAGIFVGLGLAQGLSTILKAVGAELPANSLVVLPRTIIVSLLIGVCITLISSLIPALRSTRVPPIAALSETIAVGGRNRVLLRSILSALLTVVGLALIAEVLINGSSGGSAALRMGAGAICVLVAISIFSPQLVRPAASAVGAPLERAGGLTGQLARENSQRNPSRTAVTAAALMIGLALVSFVTVFASGLSSSVDKVIEQNFKGEIVLQSSGGFLDFPSNAVTVASGVDGVQAASGQRFGMAAVDGENTSVSSIQPATAAEVVTFDWNQGSDQNLTLLEDDQAIISEGLADSQGVGPGDRIAVQSQRGAEREFEVTAVVAPGTLDLTGELIVTQETIESFFGFDADSSALVKTAPGADVDQVQDRIKDKLEKPFPTVDVLNQQELKDTQQDQINTLLYMIYVLLALAVVVSLVGIVVTLILSIHERTRELGMLRAVGMSRRQIRRMVRYEAVITAVLGAGAGLIIGVLFAFLLGIPLEEDGFALSYPIPTLIVILILTALAGVVAAIYPARKASRLDVLEAISYE
ncbi:MAG: ABC transporter permease [Thermoleophilia bacterium]|nr:ABC transporter permease [Thermoleophilia bacterium]